jgi:segregation and condensation protein B
MRHDSWPNDRCAWLSGDVALGDAGAGVAARYWQLFVRSAADRAGADAPRDSQRGLRTPKLARLEAVLLVADGALPARKLAQLATLADAAETHALVETLNSSYAADDSAFRIERVAAGYRMLTLPKFSYWLNKLHQRQAELKLSPPALETLTIVAYRQPITRADIEAVRGVQCAEMLKFLMERGLVRIAGEDASLGRPYLYGTTRRFLEIFGLRNLEDLPAAERLRQPSATPGSNTAEVESDEPPRENRSADSGPALADARDATDAAA